MEDTFPNCFLIGPQKCAPTAVSHCRSRSAQRTSRCCASLKHHDKLALLHQQLASVSQEIMKHPNSLSKAIVCYAH